MKATPETLRHYGRQALELAAEMRVDGYDPDAITVIEAAGGTLLIEAVKQERQAGTTSYPKGRASVAPAGPDLGPFVREPLEHDTARRIRVSYTISPTGQLTCCGHDRGVNLYPEHFEFCPNYVAVAP